MNKNKLYNIALKLAIATFILTFLEGLVSTYFGFEDENLTLFGFGVGSYIEVISSLGVAIMIIRINRNEDSKRTDFEKTALKITGYCFYFLSISLILTAIYNFLTNHKPDISLSGVYIAIVSIFFMYLLYYSKQNIGKKLNSDPILADAKCTKVCIYMSLVLLVSSVIYYFTKIGFIDSIGSLGLAYLSFKEGKECFENINSEKYCRCS
jgi:divalent metal cation (Fe/Co/Zn/Cd) transporter